MSRLITASLNLIILIGSVPGQGGFVINKLEKINDEERAVLRKGFKLPDTATISSPQSFWQTS